MDFLDQALAIADSQPATTEQKDKLPRIKPFALKPGNFLFRPVSHPERCPKGVHLYVSHEIQNKMPPPGQELAWEDRKEYYGEILCTLTTHGTVSYRDERGAEKARLETPCFVCDLYKDLCDSYGIYEDKEDGTKKFVGFQPDIITDPMSKAIKGMSQQQCLKYLWPGFLQARKILDGKYDAYLPSDNPKDLFFCLLEFMPYKYSRTLPLLKKLNQICKDVPDLFDPQKGRWLSFAVPSRGETLVTAATQAQPLEGSTLRTYNEVYPNLIQWGRVEFPGAAKRDLDYDSARYSMENVWFLRSLHRKEQDRGKAGYFLDDVPRGAV